MIYVKSLFACVLLATIVTAQLPNLGYCPEREPMRDFDRENFLGKWFEIERYFTVSEITSRCVSVTYERRADGKIYVNNESTSRITSVQRIVSGVLNQTARSDVGTFTVKYTGPVNYETTLHVLDTDYDSYALIWSCSSFGPVRSESTWILARERIPDGNILQAAYGVLDKYKISRTFFVKTDQTNCETEGEVDEAIDGPDTGYDIVVDDETANSELLNNQYGHDNPQIHQVQHIAHVQNLQQFSPAYPVQPIYRPNVHNSGLQGLYFKQNDSPAEKSVNNINETEQKPTETKSEEVKPAEIIPAESISVESKATDSKIEQTKTVESTEKAEKIEKVEQPDKSEKSESIQLPCPMNKILGVDTMAKEKKLNTINKQT